MTIEPRTDALGVIDVQRAFMAGGSLPTPDGRAVVPPINRLLRLPFAFRFATQDWHPPGHVSFASSHPGRAPMDVVPSERGPVTLWPDHALQGAREASLHRRLDTHLFDLVVRKGNRPNSIGLSPFEPVEPGTGSGLASLLREIGIRRLFLAGLAFDVCVAASATDAVREGFATIVVEDACRPGKPRAIEDTRSRLRRAGVDLLHGNELG